MKVQKKPQPKKRFVGMQLDEDIVVWLDEIAASKNLSRQKLANAVFREIRKNPDFIISEDSLS